MLPKPGKPVNDAKSYRRIALLSMLVFEILFLRMLKKIIEGKQPMYHVPIWFPK